MTGAKFQVFFNLATCPNYSITKYAKIPVFHFFDKMNKGQLKWYMSTIKNGLNEIIKELGTSFQSPAFSQKHVRNVFHTAH